MSICNYWNIRIITLTKVRNYVNELSLILLIFHVTELAVH